VGARAVEPLVAEDLEPSADSAVERRPRAAIRPYRPADRAAVRHVCCETGFSGRPVEPLFSDRELFADFLTRYYTDFEPESILVVEDGGRVVGYLTGCARFARHRVVQLAIGVAVAARALWRLARGRYDRASRAYVAWAFFRANRELPDGVPRSGHFHFNLLPPYRSRGIGVRLLSRFLASLDGRRVRRVYGRIETPDGRRPDKVFERFGFRLVDRRRMRRPPDVEGPVWVATYVREVAGGER
jgi:GNAT superfamily N-acetyltransferase